jgi:ankyrin repeat protein
MNCKKVALFILTLVVFLVLTGCGRGARKDVTQETQDGMVCLKSASLKLISAALNRNTATMEAAIRSGADVNVMVEGLGPPIVVTSVGDNYSGIQLLLDRAANINAEDSDGYTALMIASLHNNLDILRLLLSKGVDVNAPSNLMVNGKKAGLTPLMIAKAKGHQEIVKLLTEAGATK